MALKISESLKRGEIKLQPWPQGKGLPPATSNHMTRIVRAARYFGMTSIPAKTVEKLKDHGDPFFKYMFLPLKYLDSVQDEGSIMVKQLRYLMERRFNEDTFLYNDDLCKGIQIYLGNFTQKMPGGFYRSAPGMLVKGPVDQKKEKEEIAIHRQLFDQVDKLLEERGQTSRAANLLWEKEKERFRWPEQEKRLAYLKFCFEVFETLVEKYHYDPEFLRK